jgi:hypothetical protein
MSQSQVLQNLAWVSKACDVVFDQPSCHGEPSPKLLSKHGLYDRFGWEEVVAIHH